MKRKSILFGLLLLALITGVAAGAQTPALTLELSGINAVDLPRVDVTVNVYDALGQPLNGLTAENFRLSGPLAEVATITRVENIANNALPFASVLVIDASDSMAGAPIEQARAAARTYVENVRPIDPVAVVAFGSTVELLQDFTTDRDALLAAIDSIDLLGRTALYQAAHEGVNLANNAPEPRRAMVLLSDGAEYGGLSTVTPEDVFENAFLNGVPSYTIGLGFGADRSFLEQLSTETLAQFFESPTPDELEAIYQALADRLSSQYILTLEVNAPLDGAEYPFGLTVETDDASASQFGTVRAPIPVPVVDLSGLPSEPISEITELVIAINADQDIARVTGALGGAAAAELSGPPYTLQIDPVEYLPGPLALEVTATDVDGDTGSGSATLEIAALPPQISLSRDVSELGEINEPLEITVNVFGQTPVTEVRLSLNGGEFVTLEAPYTFVLDPLELPPGDNHLDVVAVNESGLEATYPADFIIADVPPVVAVEGVSDGQSVDAPVSFSINADGQTPVSAIVVTVNGEVLEPVDGVYTLDPQTIAPGAAELAVSVTTDQGQTGTASVTLMIAPLPPIVTVTGIEDSQTVAGDVMITLDAVTQTPVTSVSVTVNGVEVARPSSVPATVILPLSAMQPGENTAEVTVNTQAGQSSSVTFTFNAPGSLFTPTPDALATGTAAAQAAATRTAVAAAAAGDAATQSAGTQIAATESAVTSATQSAATAQAQAAAQTEEMQATASAAAIALTVTAEADANRTQTAATSTAAQNATATAQTEENQATASAAALARTVTAEADAARTQAAATSIAAQNATATAHADEAQATASAVALALTVTAEADASQTQAAATAVAQAATPSPAPASATPAPPVATGTPTASSARATAEAASVLVQQAATSAGATIAAQQTSAADAQASTQSAVTQAANATTSAATQAANATTTREAQAAQATVSAATQAANAMATREAQAANATATREAQATSQVQTNQTATALAESISAATAQAGSTATQQAEATRAAQTAATATSRANDAATAAAATQTAEAAAIEADVQTATASAERAAATQGAQATRTARAVLAAGTATAQATADVTAEAQAAQPSPTVQPTLTPVEVEPEEGGGATTGLWAIFFVIIILAVLLVIAITRLRKGRMRQ